MDKNPKFKSRLSYLTVRFLKNSQPSLSFDLRIYCLKSLFANNYTLFTRVAYRGLTRDKIFDGIDITIEQESVSCNSDRETSCMKQQQTLVKGSMVVRTHIHWKQERVKEMCP